MPGEIVINILLRNFIIVYRTDYNCEVRMSATYRLLKVRLYIPTLAVNGSSRSKFVPLCDISLGK
jgi:hypothetical protein